MIEATEYQFTNVFSERPIEFNENGLATVSVGFDKSLKEPRPYNKYSIAAEKAILDRIYRRYTGEVQTVSFLADFHCPDFDANFFHTYIKNNRDKNLDLIILGGDVFDCGKYSSKFVNKDTASIADEKRSTEYVFSTLRKSFPNTKILYIIGNHEKRIDTYIYKGLGDVTNDTISTGTKFIDELCNKYQIEFLVSNVIQIGDVIFTHGTNYNKNPLISAEKDVEHYKSLRHILPNENFKALIMGHTHHAANFAATSNNSEIFIAESGCMCHDIPQYHFDSKCSTAWKNGYATIRLNRKGEFLVNESRVYMANRSELDNPADYCID